MDTLKDYYSEYDAYMQSYNTNDSTSALFKMIGALLEKITELEIKIENLTLINK